MALIVLASDKGSPGVTTTSVALAGVWPRRAILAECDPSGGDLVYRSPAENGGPLNPNIGMLSLATMARHGLSAHQLGDHLQRIHGGLEVIAGLATGDQSAGLTGLWPHLGRAFDALPETDVIADCGRVESNSASLELMSGAALIVLVARTSAEQIAHIRDRALSLVQRVGGGNAISSGGLGVPIGIVLIVDPKQRGRVTGQVDELLRNSGLPVKVIGTIADDPDGADLINGRGRGRLDKTLLIRSAREVSLDLYRRFATSNQSAAPSRPAPGGGASGGAPANAPMNAPVNAPPNASAPHREADRPAPQRADSGPITPPSRGDGPTGRTPMPPPFEPSPFEPPPFDPNASGTTGYAGPPQYDAGPNGPYGPPPTGPNGTGLNNTGPNTYDPRAAAPGGRPVDFDTRPGSQGAPADFDTRPAPRYGATPAPPHGAPTGFDASSNSFDPAVPTGRRALPPSDRDDDLDRERNADRRRDPRRDSGSGGHRAGPPQQGVR